MIRHYFKLAKKNIVKNKYYTLINVFGLVCGMLSALIIAKYIGGSLYFDSFHSQKDQIYSLTQVETSNDNPPKESNGTYWGVGELLKQYPEVAHLTRYAGQVGSVVETVEETGNKVSFVENRIVAVDSGFLKIFSFPLVHGDSATALHRTNSIVITNAISEKYFGNINPVGKVLTIRTPWGSEASYEVTGVTKDTPAKSRFNFDFLITPSGLDPNEFWLVPDCATFVLLKGDQSTELTHKLARSLDNTEQLKATNRKVGISLESLAAIRLTSSENLLAAVGAFIILISWINYINQIVAQSYLRIKQIAILRVMGSTKGNLKTQFIVESALICLVSFTLIIVLYLILEPYMQSRTSGHMLPLINDPSGVNVVFIGIFIAGIALAAFIPSVIFFSQNFAATLRSAYGKIENVGLRKGLVVVQFSISTVLMVSLFVISNQLDFMRHKDKGINMESVLIIKDPMSTGSVWHEKRKSMELFKERCTQLPFVSQATSSTTIPGEEYRHEVYVSYENNDKKTLVHLAGVDEHFFDLYGAEFVAGHGFIADANFQNRNSIILSESAARAFGLFDLDKMIGAKIIDHESNTTYDLIGIVKDYHQTSLKYQIKPMAFRFNPFMGHFSLRISRSGSHDNSELTKEISAIRQVWMEVYHDAAFDCFLLNERFEIQDAEDRQFGLLFRFFTGLSIVISCLGLFGLSLLISTRRNREVGIRKSFGASSFDILTVFLKGYLKPLIISVLTGAPMAYFLMDTWLSNYSYRVGVGFWPVLLAVFSLSTIFLFTVSYHAIKSARANPVTILRD